MADEIPIVRWNCGKGKSWQCTEHQIVILALDEQLPLYYYKTKTAICPNMGTASRMARDNIIKIISVCNCFGLYSA